MQNLKTLVSVICLIILFSCSQEQEVITESDLVTEVTITKAPDTSLLLVEYHEHVDERRKEEIRAYYKEIKFLFSWIPCDDPKIDLWTVEYCSKETDTPVNTDDDDDVHRIALEEPCPKE